MNLLKQDVSLGRSLLRVCPPGLQMARVMFAPAVAFRIGNLTTQRLLAFGNPVEAKVVVGGGPRTPSSSQAAAPALSKPSALSLAAGKAMLPVVCHVPTRVGIISTAFEIKIL